jgi:DNA polymerase-3 subunit gamma/tau
MVEQLRRIASAEGLTAEDSALWEIARSADGALRDAISLLEQVMAVGHGALTMNSVRTLFGGGSRAEMERWVAQMREHPYDASATLKQTLDLGVSPERFLDGLFPLLRDMWTFGLWGEKSFAGTSLSDDEKNFLREEAPNWNVSCLRRAVMATASLFPRARFGLRNDVFSGLLLFELLSALNSQETIAEKSTRQTSAELSARPSGISSPAPGRVSPIAKDITPPPSGADAIHVPETRNDEDIRPALNGESGKILSRLMKDDLPLAAALLNVRIFRAGNALEFDFSEAPQPAVNMLTGGRAAAAVERVFGVAPDAPGADRNDDGPSVNSLSPAALSPVSMISARLGADILMSKRLDSDEIDDDIGDEENE